MIEAVNASISTTPVVKAIAEETSSSTSFAANPSRSQKAAVGTPYLSLQVKLAPKSKPIFVVRDTETGNAIKQFPTEAQIRAYQKAVEVRASAAASAAKSASEDVSPEAAKAIAESSVEFKEERKVATKAEINIPGSSIATSDQAPLKIGGTKTSFSTDV